MFQDLRCGARMLLKTPSFILIAVLMLALLIGAIGDVAQTTAQSGGGPLDPKELEQFLGNFMAEHLEKDRISGAAFVMVKDGKTFFKKGYGFANLARQQRVAPDSSIFRIGSISKVFTADAVMQLADRGVI